MLSCFGRCSNESPKYKSHGDDDPCVWGRVFASFSTPSYRSVKELVYRNFNRGDDRIAFVDDARTFWN